MVIQEIPCNFVGSFKVGDNLVYNSELLCKLCEQNENSQFNKLIVVQIGALIEACLTQIIYRAQNFNHEGVPNIAEEDRLEIEGKRIDKFAVVIDILRKYEVLNDFQPDIYDELHRLRKYRNKIHIQENVRIEGAPRDDEVLFDDGLRQWAILLNAGLLGWLSQNLARPPHLENYVTPLRIPS